MLFPLDESMYTYRSFHAKVLLKFISCFHLIIMIFMLKLDTVVINNK